VAVLARTGVECAFDGFMWCTQCQTDTSHRSHRAGLKEHLASLAGYYPYRCRKCGSRFQEKHDEEPEPASVEIRSVEREIAAMQRARRRRARRRGILPYGGALLLFGLVLYLFLMFLARGRITG
jgi:hypothetical protein